MDGVNEVDRVDGMDMSTLHAEPGSGSTRPLNPPGPFGGIRCLHPSSILEAL